jgi:hypothetical protein
MSNTNTQMDNHNQRDRDAICEIRAAYAAAPDAYLWVHAGAGDVILWPSESASEGDDGSQAIGRWNVSREGIADLCDLVDEYC